MSEVLEDLLYSDDHYWIREEGGQIVTIGITDYLQASLGEITFVELPEIGEEFEPGEEFGLIESLRSALDLYAPLSGKVTEINGALENAPELMNDDPYGDGWLYRLKVDDRDQLEDLMSADSYQESLDEEDPLEDEDD